MTSRVATDVDFLDEGSDEMCELKPLKPKVVLHL